MTESERLTMDEKILCPWCGGEMQIFLGAIYPKRNGVGLTQNISYYCDKCGARSPCIHDNTLSREEAAQVARCVAQTRWQEPNRVLTLEDFDQDEKAVWVEDKKGSVSLTIMRYIVPMYKPAYLAGCDFESDTAMFETKTYAISWRCWLRKPTDEERAAVPWEEADNERT